MPVYEYVAVRGDGKQERGLEFGTSIESAARSLAERGYQIHQIKQAEDGLTEAKTSPPEGKPAVGPSSAAGEAPPLEARPIWQSHVVGGLAGRVSLDDLQFLFRQMATMFKAGVGPAQVMDTMATSVRSARLASIVREAKGHVMAGRPASACFQRYPEVFPAMVVSMYRVGEQSGFLDRSCQMIADYLAKDIELRNLIRRETFYPKMVLVMSIFIILGANFVISAVAPGSPGLESPLTNPSVWLVLGPLIVLVILYVKVGQRFQRVRHLQSAVALRIPWFGTIPHHFAMARFGRALAAMWHAGVPLANGLEHAADACGNEAIRARVYPAISGVQEGRGLFQTMAQTGVFNRVVLDMAYVGETTGEVGGMLDKVAEYYEDEGQTKAKMAGIILGVVVFLCVAIYVAFVVISFYAGYFGQLGGMV